MKVVEGDPDMDMILADMRQEFIESSEDRLDEVEEVTAQLLNKNNKVEYGLLEIKRHIHSLKGLGGCFGFPAVSIWAHALEDYLEAMNYIGAEQVWDIQLFLDSIRDVLEAGRNPSDEEIAAALKSMPLKGIEQERSRLRAGLCVLLLMPRGIQRKIINRELTTFGFKVIIVESSMQAIDLAITLRPDVVISSMILDRMTGIELARILGAIDGTAHNKFLLLTASDEPATMTGSIPDNVRIAKKGRGFSRDLIKFLNDNDFLV